MRPVLTSLVWLGLAAPLAKAADAVPEWVKEAAAATVPAYAGKVTSVKLFQEEVVAVDADGRRVMRERGVVKILQPGDNKAEAHRTYNAKSGKIRDFQGWLIPPSGKPTVCARNRVVDVALSQDSVYDEARAKILECGGVTPGSVFAWEVTEEERSVFTQDAYAFQGRLPVLRSRFSLTLPAGWEAQGIVFNRDHTAPVVSGNTYTWELRDLPWIENEDHSPNLGVVAPRLLVSFFPPADNRAGMQGLKDWSGVSAWLAPLVDPPTEVTEAVRAKALQVMGNAASELERLRAIAAFTQQVNYVEISLNLTRGGGYTPHRAEETLLRNYGDCKDKATLMRALLKAANIESYLVVIDAEDRMYVRPEWASPSQFDHAIVAVRVSDAVSLPTVLPDTPLGRLLVFDPTDSVTALGDLPRTEQGSHALVIAGPQGALLSMPQLPATANRIDSSVDTDLDLRGRLNGMVRRQYFGQSGILLRAIEKRSGKDELSKRFERSFALSIGAVLNRVSTESAADPNSLMVNIELVAEHFVQSMQGSLFIVRPGMLSSGGEYTFTSKQRNQPIELESDLRHDTIRIKMPPGFKLDELPPPIKIESPYGNLDANWSVVDGAVVMRQTLEIREQVAPAADYSKVRDFFDQVAAARGAPVVLIRQ